MEEVAWRLPWSVRHDRDQYAILNPVCLCIKSSYWVHYLGVFGIRLTDQTEQDMMVGSILIGMVCLNAR